MSFRKHGMHYKSRLLQNLQDDKFNKHIQSIFKKDRTCLFNQRMFSIEKALNIFITADLSKFQYVTIRNEAIKCNSNHWPSYSKLLQEKKNCYPEKQTISVTEKYAKVEVQSLLNHTAKRILKCVRSLTNGINLQLLLTCKWGCDGCSGLSRYKQMQTDLNINDESVFVSSLVPLELKNKITGEILWHNQRPSSPWFCRPIKFEFVKETHEVIETEINSINYQIRNLQSLKIRNIEIDFTMILTMVDNKVCNAITNTQSAMRCYICNAKPTEMNKIDVIKSNFCDSTNYAFGLSTLHAWIRCFECLLHISYNLSFKRWTANSPELKKIREERKKQIQKDFKERMGLLVDVVKQGWGSSNDGNTARKFFSNPQVSADITGIDVQLIRKFHTILQVISSPHKIDLDKFGEYTKNTTEHFINLYGWYYMPASVHKLLIHGKEIIKYALLPICELSEEAQESRHKDLKKFRTKNTRKNSRMATNEDLFNRLLLTSDPYISTLRIKSHDRKIKILDPEAQDLLMK